MGLARLVRALLPHRVMWAAYAGDTGDGAAYEPAMPARARVEKKTKVIVGPDGRTATASHFLFLDARLTPDVLDRLVVDGTPLRILEVATMVDLRGVASHHEVWAG